MGCMPSCFDSPLARAPSPVVQCAASHACGRPLPAAWHWPRPHCDILHRARVLRGILGPPFWARDERPWWLATASSGWPRLCSAHIFASRLLSPMLIRAHAACHAPTRPIRDTPSSDPVRHIESCTCPLFFPPVPPPQQGVQRVQDARGAVDEAAGGEGRERERRVAQGCVPSLAPPASPSLL